MQRGRSGALGLLRGVRKALGRATFLGMHHARFYFWHFELPLIPGAGVANA